MVRDKWRPLIAKFATAARLGLDPSSAAAMVHDQGAAQSLEDLSDALDRWVDHDLARSPALNGAHGRYSVNAIEPGVEISR